MGQVFNPEVRDFWLQEYEGYPANFRAEAIAPLQNKVGAFLADPLLNQILTKKKSAFDLRRVMDEGKILLVNLSKGKIGEHNTALLGALLVAKVGLTALTRADVDEADRKDFFVFLDEFHGYTSLSLANMLSELRKYHVGLVLAHQYLTQLPLDNRDAILGNVGTMITFRIGPADAKILGAASQRAERRIRNQDRVASGRRAPRSRPGRFRRTVSGGGCEAPRSNQ